MREIARSIRELSASSYFAIVWGYEYRRITATYPSSGKPAKAETDEKSRAVFFLATQPARGAPSFTKDLLKALVVANEIPAKRRVVIVFGDFNDIGRGVPASLGLDGSPESVVAAITAANEKKVQINVIAVGTPPSAEPPLKDLAAKNGGTYRRIGPN